MTRELSEISLGYEWLLELWDAFAPSGHVPAICWARAACLACQGGSRCSYLQGTRAHGSLTPSAPHKTHSVFPCWPRCLRANSTQHTASPVQARIWSSSSTDWGLLVISKGQWSVGPSAQGSAVSLFGLTPPSPGSTEQGTACAFSLFHSTVSEL